MSNSENATAALGPQRSYFKKSILLGFGGIAFGFSLPRLLQIVNFELMELASTMKWAFIVISLAVIVLGLIGLEKY